MRVHSTLTVICGTDIHGEECTTHSQGLLVISTKSRLSCLKTEPRGCGFSFIVVELLRTLSQAIPKSEEFVPFTGSNRLKTLLPSCMFQSIFGTPLLDLRQLAFC